MCCQVWLLCSLTFAYRPCVSLLVNVKQRGLWAEAAAAGVPQLRKTEEGERWSPRFPRELSEGSSALDLGPSLSVLSQLCHLLSCLSLPEPSSFSCRHLCHPRLTAILIPRAGWGGSLTAS